MMATGKRRMGAMQRRMERTAWLFLLPSLVCFLIFMVYPLLDSLALSFFKWDGLSAKKFIGFDNYARLGRDGNFRVSMLNNLYYTGVSVPLMLLLAFLLACAMNSKVRGIGIFRVIYYLPNISAAVSIGIIWATIMLPDGPLNSLLRLVGVANPPRWLNASAWAMPSVIIVCVWRSMGYYAIIMLAGLQGIPDQLYEAANIDGASAFKKLIHITLPMLSPTMFFCTIMSLIGSFQVFDTIMAMTEGGPGRATNVIVLYIYNSCFRDYKFGYASAMAYVLFFVVLILTVLQFRGQKKWVNY